MKEREYVYESVDQVDHVLGQIPRPEGVDVVFMLKTITVRYDPKNIWHQVFIAALDMMYEHIYYYEFEREVVRRIELPKNMFTVDASRDMCKVFIHTYNYQQARWLARCAFDNEFEDVSA